MVRGAAAMRAENRMKAAAQETESVTGRASDPVSAGGTHGEIERPPYPRNSKGFRDARDGIQHGREQVRVLVGVEMSRTNAAIGNLADLSVKFVVDTHAPQRECLDQACYGRRIAWRADQRKVASDIQRRILAGETQCVVKRRSVRH